MDDHTRSDKATPAIRATGVCAALLGTAPAAHAHSFGVVYTLPVPFWLYAWGAAATLVLSFVVVGLFAARGSGLAPTRQPSSAPGSPRTFIVPQPVLVTAQAAAVAALALCISTGWFGTPNPYGNFNMTFFWIIFLLGFAYATAVIGNVYACINPWQTLSAVTERSLPAALLRRPSGRAWITWPRWLGAWPAIVLYGALIWLELFGGTSPARLSNMLAGYTVLSLVAAWLFGPAQWFARGDPMARLMRLLGRMAPVEWLQPDTPNRAARFKLRLPFSGLAGAAPRHWTGLLFILLVLSSTAFDSLHESRIWVRLYWSDLYTSVLYQWAGSNPVAAFPALNQWYQWWQTAWLLLAPLLYLALYTLATAAAWAISGRRGRLRHALLRFAASLLPIALAYHVAHYYTLLQTHGVKILALASDPYGLGWNLLGTANWYQRAIVPDVATVWHVQVFTIVAGHVVSVYIAHLEALRWVPQRGRAALTQLPMLALMVAFTISGLWLLSQPIQAG